MGVVDRIRIASSTVTMSGSVLSASLFVVALQVERELRVREHLQVACQQCMTLAKVREHVWVGAWMHGAGKGVRARVGAHLILLTHHPPSCHPPQPTHLSSSTINPPLSPTTHHPRPRSPHQLTTPPPPSPPCTPPSRTPATATPTTIVSSHCTRSQLASLGRC